MKNQSVYLAAVVALFAGGIVGLTMSWGQVAGGSSASPVMNDATGGAAAPIGGGQIMGGDGVVDGIGEASLIARYEFNGDANDRSRDGRNGVLHGKGATFVDDKQFGKVLSLSGEAEAYVELPNDALNDAESLSIV